MTLGVKNPPTSAGDARDAGLIPGSGRSPGVGNGAPLQYSCLENPMDRGAWRAIVYGVAKSWPWLSDWAHCLGNISVGLVLNSVWVICSGAVVWTDWATSLSLFTFLHWRRKWQPTPVFLPGESQGWGSLVGCRLWRRTESDTTEVT